MPLVRATARGYALDRVIEPGEEFEWCGPLGKWMEQVPRSPASATSPTPTAPAPSTLPVREEATLNDLLAIAGEFGADDLTESGFVRKAAFEARLGKDVSQSVFGHYMKYVKEQRAAAA